MKTNNYEIRNQSETDEAELFLYGIVGDYCDELDAGDIVKDLSALNAKQITVRIYSSGGSVFAGLAIYNALKAHPAKILVKIDSLAASIASVIAMSGTVEMPENAFMMIHNPWAGAIGEAEDLKKMADTLDKIKTSLMSVYNEKTGLGTEKISAMMDEETWLSARDAVELGFADRVSGAVDAKNFKQVFNLMGNFKKVPDKLKAIVRDTNPIAPSGGDKENNMTITIEKIKSEYPDIAKALKDEGAQTARDDAYAAGAKNERERIQAVSDQLMPGHEALIKDLMYDGKTTGEQAAVKVLQAEKQIRVNALKNLDDGKIAPVDAVTPPDVEPSADGSGDDSGEFDEAEARADFAKSKALKKEFGDPETYLAYRKAAVSGNVKVFNHK